MKGFIEFVREQGVFGFATGVILGGATSKLVTAMIEDFINPAIGVFFGNIGGLPNATYRVGNSVFKYGHFISVMLDFIVIAMVVYFVFKKLAARIDRKKQT
jgi:large conductance mechanosensitive channel